MRMLRPFGSLIAVLIMALVLSGCVVTEDGQIWEGPIEVFLDKLAYPYHEESDNPAYQLFLS